MEVQRKGKCMWATEVRKGFLKEVRTELGFAGFHGEKTQC